MEHCKREEGDSRVTASRVSRSPSVKAHNLKLVSRAISTGGLLSQLSISPSISPLHLLCGLLPRSSSTVPATLAFSCRESYFACYNAPCSIIAPDHSHQHTLKPDLALSFLTSTYSQCWLLLPFSTTVSPLTHPSPSTHRRSRCRTPSILMLLLPPSSTSTSLLDVSVTPFFTTATRTSTCTSSSSTTTQPTVERCSTAWFL